MKPPAHTITDEQFQGVVLLGLDNHDALRSRIEDLAQLDTGFTPPIYLVETDLRAAREAAVQLGLGNDGRYKGFFGPNAARELIAALSVRKDKISIPQYVYPCGKHDPAMINWIKGELDKIRDEQREHIREWSQEILDRASHRDGTYWANRFRVVREGEPARVLILTTRFSTYMQHSNRDLARSLEHLGHNVLVLTEPDQYTMLTPQLSIKAHLDFDPDIVITTNYPRASLADFLPGGCVNVCWVQDAMAHLFCELPEDVSPLDYLVGFVFPGAAGTRQYQAGHQLALPMPVSESKFTPDPVSGALKERYTCDIAYISHQSGTIESLRSELNELADPALYPLLDEISSWVDSIASRYHDTILNLHEGSFVDIFHDKIQRTGNPEIGRALWHQYAYPLLERTLRHDMLKWSCEVAQRHGLDFRLYGKGWDQHPVLAEFAHPELTHGEELRASYQCARVQLHASTLGVSHQRLYECAFSGGFMLSRRNWHDFVRLNWEDALKYVRSEAEPDACLIDGRHGCYSLRNHPQLQQIMIKRQQMPQHPVLWDTDRFPDVFLFHPDYLYVDAWDDASTPFTESPLRMLSDPYETTFATKDELEELIIRACNDDQWRSFHASRTRGIMLEHVSMGRFASDLIDFLCDRLCQPSGLLHEETVA
jgi:hypothetical protein